MKNTTKNTSVTPRATFDQMPRPNQSAKIGAKIRRGIEFSALMKGSATTARNGLSASHNPEAQAQNGPDSEGEQRLDQGRVEMNEDRAGHEPGDDALRDADGIAEENGDSHFIDVQTHQNAIKPMSREKARYEDEAPVAADQERVRA